MNRAKKRKTPCYLDAADVPILNTKRPIYNEHTDPTRPTVKLRSLVDQGNYEEAKTLFIEIVKSNKYHFKNLWRVGIEIIGKTSPKDLLGYLKAVFISSPPVYAPETFNVYIDQLILEENFEEALEEIELRYDNSVFHHPILLRKMAICSYHLWKKAKDRLPESYFEDEDDRDQYDLNIIQYEKRTPIASRYLSQAHATYLRDAELLDIYFDFLTLIEDKYTIKEVVLNSLKAHEKNPDYYLLFTLLKINNQIKVFETKDYILSLYELNPNLKTEEMNLDKFCQAKCIEIVETLDDAGSSLEDLEKAYALALRIFKLYIYRFEHGNPETWFQEVVMELFNNAMSEPIVKEYHDRHVDTLLRSPFIKNKISGNWSLLVDLMKELVRKYEEEHTKGEGEEANLDEQEQEEEQEEDIKEEPEAQEEGEEETDEDDEETEEEQEEEEEEAKEEQEYEFQYDDEDIILERESFMDF